MIRLALSDLRAHRLRTLLSTLAVVFGVALITGALTLTGSMNRAATSLSSAAYHDVDAAVTAKNVAQNSDTSDQISGKPTLPASALARVAANPLVGSSAAEVLDDARIIDKHGKVAGQGPYFGVGYDFSRPGAARLSPLRLHGGHWPTAAGEVVLDQSTSEKQHLNVGDTARIAGSGRAQPFRVVGVASFGDVKSLGTATIAVFTVPQAQQLFAKQGRIDTVLAAGRRGIDPARLRAGLASGVAPHATVQTAQAQDRFTLDGLKKFVSIIRTILLALGGIAVLVGALTIANALSMAVGQQTRALALLRSVGASRRQVRRLILLEALPLGIIGTVAGVVGGFGLAIALGKLFSALGMDLPMTSSRLSGGTLAAAVIIGVGVPLAAALRPARRATRVAPVIAMREAEVAAKVGVVGRVMRALVSVLGLPAQRLGGVAGGLARRNAMRNPGRTGSTAAALLIGVAVVTLAAVIANGLQVGGQGSVTRQVNADYVIASQNDGTGPTSAAALRAAAGTPGVQRVASIDQQQARVRGSVVTVDGVHGPLTSMLKYDVRSGSPDAARDLAPGQALVRDGFAAEHHIKVGRPFTLTTPEGKHVALTATAIIGSEKLNPLVLGDVTVAQAQFARTFKNSHVGFGLIDVDGGASSGRHAAIERALAAFPGAYVQTPKQWGHDLTGWLQILLAIVTAMLALAVLVSLLGIVNTLALGVVERTRELGLLRAAGMTRRQVRRMVRWESVLTALLGAVAGIMVGLGLAGIVTALLSDQGLTFHAPAATLAAVVVVAIAAGVIAAVLPARRASRLDVLQAVTVD